MPFTNPAVRGNRSAWHRRAAGIRDWARRFRTSPPGEGTQASDLKALSKELLA